MCLTRASRLSAGASSSSRSRLLAERSSWMSSLSHSSEVWCWMMKSSSSCWGGSLSGCWALRQRVEPQVVAVGHLAREVALDALLEVALAARVGHSVDGTVHAADPRCPSRARRVRRGAGGPRGATTTPGIHPGLAAHPPGADEVVRHDDGVGASRHEAEVGAEDVGDDRPLAGAVAGEVLADGDAEQLARSPRPPLTVTASGFGEGGVVGRADRRQVVDVDTALGQGPERGGDPLLVLLGQRLGLGAPDDVRVGVDLGRRLEHGPGIVRGRGVPALLREQAIRRT